MELKTCHDLHLPDWGPYSKKYLGISHLTDKKKGIRFDLSVFPGFYRRRVDVPSVLWESGYHAWEASTDLNYFCHRHELEWKDKVYTDISFSRINNNKRLVRCECVNNTDNNQNIILHFIAYMNFPPIRTYSEEIIYPCKINLPKDSLWIDALDYDDMKFAISRPTDNLVYDGFFRGEVRDNGFVNGTGLGDNFGLNKGDSVIYKFNIKNIIKNCYLMIRYRINEKNSVCIELKGLINKYINLKGNGNFNTMIIPTGDLKKGIKTIEIISDGGCSFELDGIAFASKENITNIQFEKVSWNPNPQIIVGPVPNSTIIKYNDTDIYYGLIWDFEDYELREFYCSELDRYLRHYVHEHVEKVFIGDGKKHFTNVFLRPIELTAKSKKIIYAVVCCGSKKEVENYITDSVNSFKIFNNIFLSNRENRTTLNVTPEGKKYVFSQEKMAATLLCNLVFPIYVKKEYIRHSTPGKWWDCLYTWDSGFIGLGLLELEITRAVENLNAYLTDSDDNHSAFIHHGSMVPVQFYLFHEIWNRTFDNKYLEYFYPRLRHYYRFFAGKEGSSTTDKLKSGLLKTWDYFYNSGGWDDYPPQVHVRNNKLEKFLSPVITTSQCIRVAKILLMSAKALGIDNDVNEYYNDIEKLSTSVQKHCWDSKSGYFSYVMHDKNGYPKDILYHKSGQNFNMGLDGIYPIIAGICTKEQESTILNHLESDKHLWTDIGITTIDKTAKYYKHDGYWNGAVWMSHQWFLWKTMLDLGKYEFAYKIAITALNTWKKETDETYNCMEHFIVKSGRGAGWHQFGGLSSPVLNFLSAYYIPGRLTTGFDAWIENYKFTDNNTMLNASINLNKSQKKHCCIIATMNPDFNYEIFWNDTKIIAESIINGNLQIIIKNMHNHGNLLIKKC